MNEPIATISIQQTNGFTEQLKYFSETKLLSALNELFKETPIHNIAVHIHNNDQGLKYRIHCMFVKEYGFEPLPEKLWRINECIDQNFIKKIQIIRRHEIDMQLKYPITICTEYGETYASLVPGLIKYLSDASLAELINIIYNTLPASQRKA